MKPSWPGRVKLTSGASTPRKRIPVLPSSRLTTVSPSWTCWLMVPCWRPCMPNCAWPMVSPDGSCSIALAMRPPCDDGPDPADVSTLRHSATRHGKRPNESPPCSTSNLPTAAARSCPARQRAHGSCPQIAGLALAPLRTGRILGWPAACSMVWPTSPGAMACSRWVSWPLDAPAGRRRTDGSRDEKLAASMISSQSGHPHPSGSATVG
jgi:hypothetical protein